MKMRTQNGMTLIEIIIALALFGIVALGMLVMFSSSARIVANAGSVSKAAYQMQGQVENLINTKNLDIAATGISLTLYQADGRVDRMIVSPGKIVISKAVVNGTTVDIEIFQPTY